MDKPNEHAGKAHKPAKTIHGGGNQRARLLDGRMKKARLQIWQLRYQGNSKRGISNYFLVINKHLGIMGIKSRDQSKPNN